MSAGGLLDALWAVPAVDHHAHGIVPVRPTLDEFRGMFSESPDPAQWPHVASGVTYRRAIRELAELFGLPPTEEAAIIQGKLSLPVEAPPPAVCEYTAMVLPLTFDSRCLNTRRQRQLSSASDWRCGKRLAADHPRGSIAPRSRPPTRCT